MHPVHPSAVFQYRPDGPETVLPADFLPFRIRSSVVTDAYLVDSHRIGRLSRDLRFEPETVFLDADSPDDLPGEDL